ncbi:MAG: type II toxin-antitoxin system RelE family toxin [Nitrosotalea sp.]
MKQSWEFDRKSKFKKQYKLLGSVRQEKINNALIQLANSQKPESLGVYKSSMGVYAYELGHDDRIIFKVDHERCTIELVRVGDHKMTYGKD